MEWLRTERQSVLCCNLAVLILALGAAFSTSLAAEPLYQIEVVQRYPHDSSAFTQGLFFWNGFLYESTGLYGESSLRRVRLEDGAVLQSVELDAGFFGEGAAVLNGRVFQLTWREGTGLIFELDNLEKVGEFTYQGEGWGLTTDGTHLIMSDGSSVLRFLDPETLETVGRVRVKAAGGDVLFLNELEYVAGEIWANVWLTSRICRIDPSNGEVLGWIDLSELAAEEPQKNPGADVLNGIAYDPDTGRIVVTGKLWSSVYEIVLIQPED